MKKISILGSTGSIGTQTLEVVRQNPDKLSVHALSAGTNVKLMEEQVREFISDIEHIEIVEKMNKAKNQAIFDDKALTYQHFKKYCNPSSIKFVFCQQRSS